MLFSNACLKLVYWLKQQQKATRPVSQLQNAHLCWYGGHQVLVHPLKLVVGDCGAFGVAALMGGFLCASGVAWGRKACSYFCAMVACYVHGEGLHCCGTFAMAPESPFLHPTHTPAVQRVTRKSA
jgi:hypothetical protein